MPTKKTVPEPKTTKVDPNDVGTQHPGTFKPGGSSPSERTPTATPGQTTITPKQ